MSGEVDWVDMSGDGCAVAGESFEDLVWSIGPGSNRAFRILHGSSSLATM